MTHLFVLWLALFAAQATTPTTSPPSESPTPQTAQPPAQQTAPVAPTAQAPAPACDNCPTFAVQHVQPFIAKVHGTNVQIRADGTTITTDIEEQIWRDANGRGRSESIRTPPNGIPSHFIAISDPVTHINLSWKVDDPSADKIVTVRHILQPISQSAPNTPQTDPRHYPTKSESLPSQTILGFNVPGIHRTLTIPAGSTSSDHDVTITTDYWYSPLLGIQLRNDTDDPINGKTTTETTDIQLVDPDPALFQAPADYQLKDLNPPSPNPDVSGANSAHARVTRPKVLSQPSPIFPELAKKQKINGVATVSLIVDAQGNPENVHISKSIADTVDPKQRAAALSLDQAAIDAVKKYKFKPATQDGKPVAVYLNVQVNFEIF